MNEILPLQLSASAVRDFRECAHRYALSYLAPLSQYERRPVTLLTFGEVVHAAIADFFRLGGWDEVDREELGALLDAHWHGEIYADEGIALANRELAAELLERFYMNRYPPAVARELGVERRHGWKRYHRGMMARGRIDRACLLPDGTVELIDYKTGRRRLDVEALQEDPQALFYRSLGGEAYRRLAPPRILVTFFYLATATPVPVEFEHEDFLAGWARIEAVATAIRRGVAEVVAGMPVIEAFPPNPGIRCHMCPMRGQCEALAGAEGGAA